MIWEEITQQLQDLSKQNLIRQRRTLSGPCSTHAIVNDINYLAFCSNDYLGLASHPAIAQRVAQAALKWGIGSGGSHVVNGHMQPHDQLEHALSKFVGAERALYFSTGFMANLGVVSPLVGRGDAVFADRLNHASLIDAVQLSRADHKRYAHNDIDHLENLLKTSTAKHKMILSDAVFSMDGDLAPIPDLVALAEKYDAWLVLDDAHGFGVIGEHGAGSLSHWNVSFSKRILYIGTLGKAAGVSGAFIAGDSQIIEFLMQKSRTYIFTTAASPVIAEALLTALELIYDGDNRRRRLKELSIQLENALTDTPLQLKNSPTAIKPIIVGSNEAVLSISAKLAEKGIWVPAIRPPTVPQNTARLRISLSASHTAEDINQLTQALRSIA